jgi:hypothetical protein
MNVAWCMMALALAGADDGSPGEPVRADSPNAIQIKIVRSAVQSEACCADSPCEKAQATEPKPTPDATASSGESKLDIGGIDFTGNHFASSADLKTRIASLSGACEANVLDADRQTLMDYYQSQGYFEVRVTPVTHAAEALGKVDVTFVVSEGRRYSVRSVAIEGNSQIKTRALRKGLELDSGKPFIAAVREADRNRMLIKYAKIGCIDAEICCEPKFTEQAGVVDLVYKIEEHEPYVLGALQIKGGARTKKKGLRREVAMMRLASAQAADITRVDRFRQRLLALAYFEPEQDSIRETYTESTNGGLADQAEWICEAVAQATEAVMQAMPAADSVSRAVAAFIEHDASSCVPQSKGSEATETWPLTLPQAVQIGLDNCEIVRMIAFGAQGIPIGGIEPTPLELGSAPGSSPPGTANQSNRESAHNPPTNSIVICPIKPDSARCCFKAEVIAKVRSVEQLYWNLAQAQVALWATEQAAQIAEEVVNAAAAKITGGCHDPAVSDVAEAAQRSEELKLDLAARASDVTTAERQLRTILELPPADNRRIVAVSPSISDRIALDWDRCLNEMMCNQPDVLQQKLVVNSAERERLMATEAEPAETALLRSKNYLEHVVKQTTHSLAGRFAAIDANHEQFKAASRLRTAAAQRLEAQRASYEEGRITPDRFLDAVCQYATAVGTEAQHRAMYNTAIVGLAEAKGTLLEDRNIKIAERTAARPPRYITSALHDGEAKPAAFQPVQTESVAPAADGPSKAKPATWTFSISIGKDKPTKINAKVTLDDSAAH